MTNFFVPSDARNVIVVFGGTYSWDQPHFDGQGNMSWVHASGTVGGDITYVMGSDSNDVITGNGADNSFGGSKGSDALSGGGGLDGVNYEFLDSRITINLETGIATKASGTDTLTGITNLGATAHNDIITMSSRGGFVFAGAGNDKIFATGGTTLIIPGSGNDSVVGSSNYEEVSYIDNGFDAGGAQTQGVNLNFETGVVWDGWGGTDTVSNIEGATGSRFDDVLHGSQADNGLFGYDGDDLIEGLGGNDRLDGGRGADKLYGGADVDYLIGGIGEDILDGGDGRDTVAFGDGSSSRTPIVQGVYVDLAVGVAIDGWDDLDTLFSVEDVLGTNFGDTIFGNDVENSLYGYQGDDTLKGNGGNDHLIGELGDDRLEGGSGQDILSGGEGADIIDGGTDSDFIDMNDAQGARPIDRGVFVDLFNGTATDGWGFVDAVSNVESVIGTAFNDTLYGNDADNGIFAQDGDDTIYGGKGNDNLLGEAGNDDIWAGSGFNMLVGGDGNDTFHVYRPDGWPDADQSNSIDGDDDAQVAPGDEDLLILDYSAADYFIRTTLGDDWRSTRTVLTHKSLNISIGTQDVEKVQFGAPVTNAVLENGAPVNVAREMVTLALEAYSASSLPEDRRNWHDLEAIELGMKPSDKRALGLSAYTLIDGHFHQEQAISLPFLTGVNDTDVTLELGIVDGKRVLSIAFKGSDSPVSDPLDWVQDLTTTAFFYEQHRGLINHLVDYINDAANGIQKVLVAGHSLGGAMTQRLVGELVSKTPGVAIEGYTFGSIGAAFGSGAASHITNFIHLGDMANLLNAPIEQRAGPKVYLESAEYSPLNGVRLHLADGYQTDLLRLIGFAKDGSSSFYTSALATALRSNQQWMGEGLPTLSGTANEIQVFVGSYRDDTAFVSAVTDYVLGGAGNDKFGVSVGPVPVAAPTRKIDGGTGKNILFIDAAEKRFDADRLRAGELFLEKEKLSLGKFQNVKVILSDSPGYDAKDIQKITPKSPDIGPSPKSSGVPTKHIDPKFPVAVASDGAMRIVGTSSADILYVGRGDKTLSMGAGNDIVIVKPASGTGSLKEKIAIDGGKGADIMHGGRGAETYIVDDARDIVSDDGGTDVVKAGVGFQVPDGIETLILSGKADVGLGNKGANSITGSGKANGLDGGAGSDTIAGGNGADTLTGGKGSDVLTGGKQADTFVFDAKLGKANIDVIADFKPGTDVIALDDAIFAAIGPTLDKGEFYARAGATQAHDANDHIIYNTTNGRLYFDADGKDGVKAVLFATLSGHPGLDHGDFAIV